MPPTSTQPGRSFRWRRRRWRSPSRARPAICRRCASSSPATSLRTSTWSPASSTSTSSVPTRRRVPRSTSTSRSACHHEVPNDTFPRGGVRRCRPDHRAAGRLRVIRLHGRTDGRRFRIRLARSEAVLGGGREHRQAGERHGGDRVDGPRRALAHRRHDRDPDIDGHPARPGPRPPVRRQRPRLDELRPRAGPARPSRYVRPQGRVRRGRPCPVQPSGVVARGLLHGQVASVAGVLASVAGGLASVAHRVALRRVTLRIALRRPGLLALGLGAALALAAQLTEPISAPLYDGVPTLDPYRYLSPAPGQPGDPTSYEGSPGVDNGASRAFVASTKEQPPQAQLIALAKALIPPAGATSMNVTIDPVPADTAPTNGAIAGNVYRFSVLDDAGHDFTIAPDAQPTITLRGPDGTLDAVIGHLTPSGWVALETVHGG